MKIWDHEIELKPGVQVLIDMEIRIKWTNAKMLYNSTCNKKALPLEKDGG